MSKLERLSQLKLTQPKGLRDFIWNETNYQTTMNCRYYCMEVMEKWNGTWILRVFAYKVDPKKKRNYKNIKFKEVQRKILGEKKYLVSGDVYSSMSGRRIDWDGNGRFYVVSNNWEFYGYRMYEYQDVIEDLGFQYCSWDIYSDTEIGWDKAMRFIDYLTLYQREPGIERIVKLGLGNYLPSIRYLDLSKRKIYDVFKIDSKWEFVIGILEMRDILTLRREKDIENLDDLDLYNRINFQSWNSYKNIKGMTEFKKLKQYCNETLKDNQDLHIYEDYLRFASELGYDTRRNKVLYPINLNEAHDQLMNEHNELLKERERQKIEANKSKFSKQYKKNKKHKFIDEGFIITPVRTQDELIEESTVLNHCVRSYAEQIVNGTTEILFVRKNEEPDTPFITVEVKGNKVTQVRGINNSIPPENVVSFLENWSKKKKIQYSV